MAMKNSHTARKVTLRSTACKLHTDASSAMVDRGVEYLRSTMPCVSTRLRQTNNKRINTKLIVNLEKHHCCCTMAVDTFTQSLRAVDFKARPENCCVWVHFPHRAAKTGNVQTRYSRSPRRSVGRSVGRLFAPEETGTDCGVVCRVLHVQSHPKPSPSCHLSLRPHPVTQVISFMFILTQILPCGSTKQKTTQPVKVVRPPTRHSSNTAVTLCMYDV